MMCNMAKTLLLAAVLCGLCPAVQANTTVVGASASAAPLGQSIRTAQNDIALPPYNPDAAPVTESVPAMPVFGAPARTGTVHMALLLPLRSPALGVAADAVRAGFLAAHEREKQGVSVTVLDTDGTAVDALAQYGNAVAISDVVIGPLSRSEMTAIAHSDAVRKPTIALGPPEMAGDGEMALPPLMLTVGLSVEEEARQVALWMSADQAMRKAFIISTPVAWQRRTAKTFASQWRASGLDAQAIELDVSDGFLTPASLLRLKNRMQEENPQCLFAALDAGLAAQLRLAVGTEIPLYGTSQLNPLALPDWASSEGFSDLDGAHLLDIPWQLQADHPAVMIYPRPAPGPDQRRGADLARLYALGIDAYRIAHEIALNNTLFQLDGVTGKLTISFDASTKRFERIEQQAAYQDGKVTPLLEAR